MKDALMPKADEILSALKEFNALTSADISDAQLKKIADALFHAAKDRDSKKMPNVLTEAIRLTSDKRGLERLLR